MLQSISEKMLEINILRHLANCIEQYTESLVHIISPTQNQERCLGVDDYLKYNSRVIDFQFKRPKRSSSRHASFKINRVQQNTFKIFIFIDIVGGTLGLCHLNP